MDDALEALHAPLTPILRHVLEQTPLPKSGRAIDVACGPGNKASLLATALGPGVRLVGVDRDRTALRQARRTNNDQRQIEHALWVAGDALALPLRDNWCDAVFCIAALGLFANQRTALREMRRVLRPGAPALLVVGAHLWASVVIWPDDLAACLVAAYQQALAEGIAPVPASADIVGELGPLFLEAGFASAFARAFWLDRPHLSDAERHSRHPLTAELPLLPWLQLRALLAGRLEPQTLLRADQLAADSDLVLCELALVAIARVGE